MLRSLSISEYVEEFAYLFPLTVGGEKHTMESFLSLEKQAGELGPYVLVSLTDHILHMLDGDLALSFIIWGRPSSG